VQRANRALQRREAQGRAVGSYWGRAASRAGEPCAEGRGGQAASRAGIAAVECYLCWVKRLFFLLLGCGLGVQLSACGGDAHTTPTVPVDAPAGAAGAGGATPGGAERPGGAELPPPDAGAAGARSSPDAAIGAGGSGPRDASPDASDPGDPGLPVLIALDPASIEIFDLPINSLRYAAAGRDPATGTCASIIWDYSNNDLEAGRRCDDDFLMYPSFPYVLLRTPPESCDNLQGLWDYGGQEPHFASGCFDPLAGLVDVSVEAFFNGTNYFIVMKNTP